MSEPGRSSCISVTHLNVGGHLHATVGSREERARWLATAVQQMGHSDVFVFTETWTAPGETPPPLQGYVVYACRRVWRARGRTHGGILVYVAQHLTSDGVILDSNAECGRLVVELRSVQLAIVACYFSPAGSALYESGALHSDPFAFLTDTVRQLSSKGMQPIVIGDLNARVGRRWEYDEVDQGVGALGMVSMLGPDSPPPDWDQVPHARVSMDGVVNEYGPRLLHVLATCNLVLCNGRAQGDTMGRVTCKATNGSSTVESGSVVDVACVPARLYPSVVSFTVLDHLSKLNGRLMEHAPIRLVMQLSHITQHGTAQATVQPMPRQRVRSIRPSTALQGDYASSMNSVESVGVLQFLQDSIENGNVTPTDAVSSLVAHMRDHVPVMAPPHQRRHHPRDKPWWCAALQQARYEHIGMQRALRRGACSAAQASAVQHRYRRLLSFHKGQYAQQRNRELAELYVKQPGAFWRDLKGDSRCESMPADVAMWQSHCDAVFNGPLPGQEPTPPQGTTDADMCEALGVLLPEPPAHAVDAFADLNCPLTLGEVEAALARLEAGKACDAAGVTAECLVGAAKAVPAEQPGRRPHREPTLAPLLTSLFNVIFQQGSVLPEQFALNTWTPIYKGKGDKAMLQSYRGIAVGNLLAKVYESVLYERFNGVVDSLGLRAETQFGFRRGRGTLDGLFVLQHLVDKVHAGSCEVGRVLYALFVDFAMAFDLVDREILVKVWRSVGISGVFLDALCKLYEDIRMVVKLHGQLSEPVQTGRGTKQGCELSPLYFGLFIERLRPLLAGQCPGAGPMIGSLRLPEILFADDLTLLSYVKEHMQQLLNALAVFCVLFKMRVNPTKTRAVVFRPPNMSAVAATRGCHWSFQGNPIPIECTQTFLGVTFRDQEGAGSAAMKDLATSGRKAMYTLLARMRQLHIDQSDLQCRLFDQLVEPILSYGCQIWGPAVCDGWMGVGIASDAGQREALNRQHNPADAVQIDFLRSIGGLPQTCKIWVMLAEFGRMPLQLRWLALASRFWRRCGAMQPGRLTRVAMEENIGLFLANKAGNSWVARFIRCMGVIGAVNASDVAACSTVDEVWQLSIVEADVRLKAAQWYGRVWAAGLQHPNPVTAPSDSVHISTYQHWVRGSQQVPVGAAPHHRAFLPVKVKHALIRLRVGGYPLRVEMGKRHNIERAQRVCRVCGSDTHVDNLQHFLIECPAYDDIRSRWTQVFTVQAIQPEHVLNNPDQHAVASAVYEMVKRHECPSGNNVQ